MEITTRETAITEAIQRCSEDTEIRFLQKKTHCIYARESRNWCSPETGKDMALTEYINTIVRPDLISFIHIGREALLDGYAIVLPEKFGNTLNALIETVHTVLHLLSENDPAQERCLSAEIENPAWTFKWGMERFFINTFGSCYPENHSRYAFGSRKTILFLQPRHSFTRFFNDGQSSLPDHTRARIRTLFSEHNRGYDTEISTSAYDAYRVIRPLDAANGAVQWWKTPVNENLWM